MVHCSEMFIGMDVSKISHSVAVADSGRDGEVRFYGEISSDGTAVRRFVRKLERPGTRLRFCYEAGPTGYGLQRLIEKLGHECAVIAPSLIPRRPGERVKTNRRDAVKLARLFRAGELIKIWTPEEWNGRLPAPDAGRRSDGVDPRGPTASKVPRGEDMGSSQANREGPR